MKKVMKTITIQFVLVLMSICLGALFFLQMEIEPDLSSSIVAAYQMDQYEGQGFAWNSFANYNPWNLATIISYRVFGLSEAAVKGIVVMLYIITDFLTLQLCVESKEKNSLFLLPLAFFMMMPGVATNKYHYVPVVISLLLLMYLKDRQKTQEIYRKKRDICVAALFLFLCCITPDILLVILNIFVPVTLYYVWKLMCDKRCLKYVLLTISVLMVFLVIIVALHDLGMVPWLDQIYGASSSYLAWAELPEIWENGISFLLTTIVRAMNIEVSGSIVQPISFVWIIRIALLFIAYVDLCYHARMIIKKKEDDLYWVIICEAVILSHIMQLLNGWRLCLYAEYGYYYSYCGYMGIAWPLLIVLAMDFLKRHFAVREVKYFRILYTTVGLSCTVIFLTMAVQFYRSDYQSINKEIAEYLIDNGKEAGLATDAVADDLIVWSEGDFYAVSLAYFDRINERRWGYRKFDTYIESINNCDSNEIVALDQSIVENYGEPTEKRYFYEGERKAISDSSDDKVVYFFDRDIRWPIQSLDSLVSTKKTSDVFLPLGENLITLYGNGLKDAELLFNVAEDGKLFASCEEATEEKLVYKVVCLQDVMVIMTLSKKSGMDDIVCERAEAAMLRAAIRLHEQEEIRENGVAELETQMPDGTYNIIVNGSNLDDIELICETGNAQIEVMQNGSARKIYRCEIREDKPIICIKNQGKETAVVNNVYYEATIEEREKVIEKLKEE